VAATAARLRPADLAGLAGGRFRNQLPLRLAVERSGVGAVGEAATEFRARLLAMICLHRARRCFADELHAGSALADRGLIDPAVTVAVLRHDTAWQTCALPLLRMIWIDRWLRAP